MVKYFRRVYSEILWHTEIVKFKYFLWVLNKKRFCTEYIRSSHGHHPGDHTINLPGFLLFLYDSSLDIFTIYQSFLKNSMQQKSFLWIESHLHFLKVHKRTFRFNCLSWNAHWNWKRTSSQTYVLVMFFCFRSLWEKI